MRDLFGLATAVLVAMLTLIFTPWTFAWWACVAVAGSVALLTGFHLATPILSSVVAHARARDRMIPLIGMIACGFGFVVFAVWYFWPLASSAVTPRSTPWPAIELPVIAIDCHPTSLPDVVPSNGLNYVDFVYSPGGGGPIGVGGGGVPGSKPKWSERITMPMYCEFTIHDNVELYDVIFDMHVKFHEVNKVNGQIQNGKLVAERDWPIAIGRINNNYSFGFYSFTTGNYMIYVTFPDIAKYTDGQSNRQKDVKLLTINWKALSFLPAAEINSK